jgi:hypothetical protein
MQKYTALVKHAAPELPDGFHDIYLAAEVDAVLKRQAAAAISGMNAATAISSAQVQQAHRLRAESSPEALESERQANAILTDRIAELEKSHHRYEKMRRLSPREFHSLWMQSIAGDRFDDLVDRLPS